MTDSDIVKALECCSEISDYEGSESVCCACPLITDDSCTCTLAKSAIDLINRQKYKVEAYKHYYDECLKDLKKAHAEIDRLKETGGDVG